jgi:hypothetical protein
VHTTYTHKDINLSSLNIEAKSHFQIKHHSLMIITPILYSGNPGLVSHSLATLTETLWFFPFPPGKWGITGHAISFHIHFSSSFIIVQPFDAIKFMLFKKCH